MLVEEADDLISTDPEGTDQDYVHARILDAVADFMRLHQALNRGRSAPFYFTMCSSLTNKLSQARSIRSGVILYGMPSKSQTAIIWSIRKTG